MFPFHWEDGSRRGLALKFTVKPLPNPLPNGEANLQNFLVPLAPFCGCRLLMLGADQISDWLVAWNEG